MRSWLANLLLICISVITFASIGYADEVAGFVGEEAESVDEVVEFIYQSEGRDPFTPLVTKDGKLMVSYGVINSINDVVLEGILYDPGGDSIVILNDIVLRENEEVGKIKVKKIEENMVILLYKDKEYVFQPKE